MQVGAPVRGRTRILIPGRFSMIFPVDIAQDFEDI